MPLQLFLFTQVSGFYSLVSSVSRERERVIPGGWRQSPIPILFSLDKCGGGVPVKAGRITGVQASRPQVCRSAVMLAHYMADQADSQYTAPHINRRSPHQVDKLEFRKASLVTGKELCGLAK